MALGRFNDTPLRANADLFTPALRAKVEEVYAADFDAYGDRWSFEAIAKNPPWKPEALAMLPIVADMGDRIGVLRKAGIDKTNRNRRLRSRLAVKQSSIVRLRRRVADLSQQLADLEARRPSVRLRRAVRRVVRR